MIKAVLFDLDGTLLDTNELILKSFRYAFKTILDMKPTDDEITQHFGKPLKDSFLPYTEDKVEEIIACYLEYNHKIHDDMCAPFEGVKDMLIAIKEKGIKLAIVTSKRECIATRGMKLAGIYELMDEIITPEKTEKHKPNGDPALKACEMLGIKPEEAMMVGDSNFDILCGKNAGCKTCGVRYTVLPIEELEKEKPDYFVDNALEILDVLKQENEFVA